MPVRRRLDLSEADRTTLLRIRDTDPKAYRRERAAALLKIADGTPPAVVARAGLLRHRKPDTVYGWLNEFLARGLAALSVQSGRGRKPAFSPCALGAGGRKTSDTAHRPAVAPGIGG